MWISSLARLTSGHSAHISGRASGIRARHLLVGMVLAVFLLLMSGCDAPGVTDEELDSDPMPEFEDSVVSGSWLLEGKLVTFETKVNGVYLLRDADEEESVFKLKRAGTLLMMEYAIKSPSGLPLYRPCWVGVNESAMELHCLQSGELAKFDIRIEERAYDDETIGVITDTQERLKQFYQEQANNQQVFELTMRLTRPQPARVQRLRTKAQRGDAQAQELLAQALIAGEIVEKDEDEAIEWARKSADTGRASAQVLCGRFLMDKRLRVPPTEAPDLLTEAHTWYMRAAQRNYPEAYSRLGHLYESDGLADDSSAVDSYEKGAELGDVESLAQLGMRYWSGRGVAEDEHKAQHFLELVPESRRDSSVWFTLANIYLAAFDTDQRDARKALHATENALATAPACETYALAAQAAFELGEIDKAIRYQEAAISEGRDDVVEQRAKLEAYQNAKAMGRGVGPSRSW